MFKNKFTPFEESEFFFQINYFISDNIFNMELQACKHEKLVIKTLNI